MITVRQARIEELSKITALYAEYNKVINFSPERVTETITDMIGKGNVLIGDYDGEIIGAVAGWIIPCGFTNDLMFMAMFFYVMEEFRAYTVVFMRKVEEYIAKTQCTKIVFSSPNIEHYEKYNRFYRIRGYRELETHFSKNI